MFPWWKRGTEKHREDAIFQGQMSLDLGKGGGWAIRHQVTSLSKAGALYLEDTSNIAPLLPPSKYLSKGEEFSYEYKSMSQASVPWFLYPLRGMRIKGLEDMTQQFSGSQHLFPHLTCVDLASAPLNILLVYFFTLCICYIMCVIAFVKGV